MKTKIRRLHTVLVGSYYWITPAEAHPLPIRSEWVQKSKYYTTTAIIENYRSTAKSSIYKEKLDLDKIRQSIKFLGEASICQYRILWNQKLKNVLLFYSFQWLNSKALIKNLSRIKIGKIAKIYGSVIFSFSSLTPKSKPCKGGYK